MIRIVRPEIPKVLLDKGPRALRLLCVAFDAAPDSYRSQEKFKFKKVIYGHSEVRNALVAAQHGKCAYCEDATRKGNVDHYRPKSSYRQSRAAKAKRPGYYWLAYEWANLLYVCSACNQFFKVDLFPLKNTRRRAFSRNRKLQNEEPLVIDPSSCDPKKFITFDQEIAKSVDGCLEGQTTIEIIGLNDETLVKHRRKRLEDLRALLDCRDILQERLPDENQVLLEVTTRIRASISNDGEFAGMCRALLGTIMEPVG